MNVLLLLLLLWFIVFETGGPETQNFQIYIIKMHIK